jgi:hypothetical protein
MFHRMQHTAYAKSVAVLSSLNGNLDRILQCWLVFAGLACIARIATAPIATGGADLATVAPYLLLITAPFASTLLALRWFKDGANQPQPAIRLAVIGNWRDVGPEEAARHRLYGTTGVMVSLLVGIMLNVPVRAMEYLAAMPPVPEIAPAWLSTLHLAMTLDVVLFTSLYMIAFVAGLRRVPLFPRLLLAIWCCDLAMQLVTGSIVAGIAGLPDSVASALHGLLEGNAKKVLISAAIWLPYLLLSKRVNVTYRNRVPA